MVHTAQCATVSRGYVEVVAVSGVGRAGGWPQRQASHTRAPRRRACVRRELRVCPKHLHCNWDGDFGDQGHFAKFSEDSQDVPDALALQHGLGSERGVVFWELGGASEWTGGRKTYRRILL